MNRKSLTEQKYILRDELMAVNIMYSPEFDTIPTVSRSPVKSDVFIVAVGGYTAVVSEERAKAINACLDRYYANIRNKQRIERKQQGLEVVPNISNSPSYNVGDVNSKSTQILLLILIIVLVIAVGITRI